MASPCRPPGTESPQKRSRCHFLPSTWHGILAKAFQVALLAVHLARNSCKSVPGVTSCRPPGTVFLRECSRCHFLPSTWHGIPAKAFQVASPCLPLATVSLRKRVRCLIPPPTWHGNPAKACQVSHPAFHLARNPRESVSGVLSCFPPGTESPRKRSRWHLPAAHLPRKHSLRTGGACADKLKDCNIVFSISFSYLCFRPEKIINRKDILTTSINPQSL